MSKVLDRYEIKETIGKGGAGIVYRAIDTKLNREVALKRVLPDGSEEETKDAIESLQKEAGALSALQHPNIVTILDTGIDDEGPFVVMQYIKGHSIDEMIEEGTLTWLDFQEIVFQTQEALIAAQELDLVHRDIKPSNIMVKWLPSDKFQIILLDFGLAKFSHTPSPQTINQADAVLGSIHFMAPEQFERVSLDCRTDMYQLGCLYYYALTGLYPFDGDTAPQVMAAHLNHSVTDLKTLRPDVPEWACDWVMWHINRNSSDRPASANEALEIFVKNEQNPPAPSTTMSEDSPQPNQAKETTTPDTSGRPKLVFPGMNTETPATQPTLNSPATANPNPLLTPATQPVQPPEPVEVEPTAVVAPQLATPEAPTIETPAAEETPATPELTAEAVPEEAIEVAPPQPEVAATPAPTNAPVLLTPAATAATAPQTPTEEVPVEAVSEEPAAQIDNPSVIEPNQATAPVLLTPSATPQQPPIEETPAPPEAETPPTAPALSPSSAPVLLTPTASTPQPEPEPPTAAVEVTTTTPTPTSEPAPPAPVLLTPSAPPQAITPAEPETSTPPVTTTPITPSPTPSGPLASNQSAVAPKPLTASQPLQAPGQVSTVPLTTAPTQQLNAANQTQAPQTPLTTPDLPKAGGMSGGTKAFLITLLTCLIGILVFFFVSRTSSNKQIETYNTWINKVEKAYDNDNDIPTSRAEVDQILDTATSLQGATAGERETIMQGLLRASSSDGTDLDKAIFNNAKNEQINSDIREKLFHVLGHRENSTVTRDLIKYAKNTTDETFAKVSMKAAVSTANDEHFEELLPLIAFNPNIRREAQQAIANLIKKSRRREAHASSLVKVYNNTTDEKVKLSLLDLMGYAGSSKAFKVLEQQLKSGSESEKQITFIALSNWPDNEGFEKLTSFLESQPEKDLQTKAFNAAFRFCNDNNRKFKGTEYQENWATLKEYAITESQQMAVINAIVPHAMENKNPPWVFSMLNQFKAKGLSTKVKKRAEQGDKKLKTLKKKEGK